MGADDSRDPSGRKSPAVSGHSSQSSQITEQAKPRFRPSHLKPARRKARSAAIARAGSITQWSHPAAQALSSLPCIANKPIAINRGRLEVAIGLICRVALPVTVAGEEGFAHGPPECDWSARLCYLSRCLGKSEQVSPSSRCDGRASAFERDRLGADACAGIEVGSETALHPVLLSRVSQVVGFAGIVLLCRAYFAKNDKRRGVHDEQVYPASISGCQHDCGIRYAGVGSTAGGATG